MINDLKILNVFSVIKICKRSLNGTSIHTRNCLIGNGFIQNIFLSLQKDREVVTGGTIPRSGLDVPFTVVGENTKLFNLQKNLILNLFLLMLNLQQDLREKQTQQKEESGKLSAVTGIWIVMEML